MKGKRITEFTPSYSLTICYISAYSNECLLAESSPSVFLESLDHLTRVPSLKQTLVIIRLFSLWRPCTYSQIGLSQLTN